MDLNLTVIKQTDLTTADDAKSLIDLIRRGRSLFSLALSRVVYYVREKEMYRNWPGGAYDTFDAWTKGVLERTKSVGYSLAKVYEVFIVKHACNEDRIEKIDCTKLSVVAPHTTESNIEDMLVLCETKTLFEITKAINEIRKLSGMISDQSEKMRKFTFTISDLAGETVQAALDIAKELSGSVMPGKQLEYIAADFVCGSGLNDSAAHLDRLIDGIERAFNVTIEVRPNECVDAEVISVRTCETPVGSV